MQRCLAICLGVLVALCFLQADLDGQQALTKSKPVPSDSVKLKNNPKLIQALLGVDAFADVGVKPENTTVIPLGGCDPGCPPEGIKEIPSDTPSGNCSDDGFTPGLDATGGCNADDPLNSFHELPDLSAAPVTICGEASFFENNEGGFNRDTDWYRFTVPDSGPHILSFTARTSFFADGFVIVDPGNDCDLGDAQFPLVFTNIGEALDCADTAVEGIVPPGTHYLFFSTESATDQDNPNPCGTNNEYVLENLFLEPVPTNDACEDAFEIQTGTHDYDTALGLTLDFDIPCAFTESGDVFFNFTATADGNASFTTCATTAGPGEAGSDAALAVYNTDDCEAIAADPDGTRLGCNDDAFVCPSSLFLPELGGIAVTAGSRYKVQLTDASALAGPGLLTVTIDTAPANDLWENALSIETGKTAWDNTGAGGGEGLGPVDQSCSGGDRADIWFEFTAPADGLVTASTCEEIVATDTILSAYLNTGSRPDGENPLACSEDFGCGTTGYLSEIAFSVTAGNSYLLQVATWGGEQGMGSLNLTLEAENDSCDTAFPFATLANVPFLAVVDHGTAIFDTRAATTTVDQDCSENDSQDVWFAWTAPNTGAATITTCADGTPEFGDAWLNDNVLSVYAAGAPCPPDPGVDLLACNDDAEDACDVDGFLSSVDVSVEAGNTYLVQVSGWEGAENNQGKGYLHISDEFAPANNFCDSAEVLDFAGGLTASAAFDTTGAGRDVDNPFSGGEVRDVWFVTTVPLSGDLTVSTCNSMGGTTDTTLGIYDGTDCIPASASLLGGSEDAGCGPTGFLSETVIPVVEGNSYLINVGTFFGADGAGTLDLTLSPVPDNDECENAIEIFEGSNPHGSIGATGGTDLSGFCDPGDFGDDVINDSVFYVFNAPSSGAWRFSTCGTVDYDSRIAVYDGVGCPVDASTVLGCNDDNPNDPCGSGPDFHAEVDVSLVGGNSYLVEVGGFGPGDQGEGELVVTSLCAPVEGLMGSLTTGDIIPQNGTVDAEASTSAGSEPISLDWEAGGLEANGSPVTLGPFPDAGSFDVNLTATNDCSAPAIVVGTLTVVDIGDFDANGTIDLADASNFLDYLFLSGAAPSCSGAMDYNGSGGLNLTDAIGVANEAAGLGDSSTLPAEGASCADLP